MLSRHWKKISVENKRYSHSWVNRHWKEKNKTSRELIGGSVHKVQTVMLLTAECDGKQK